MCKKTKKQQNKHKFQVQFSKGSENALKINRKQSKSQGEETKKPES